MNSEINMKEVRQEIAKRLVLAREQSGLTQAQAAKQLEIPRPSISEIEAGRRRVAAEELIAFAKLYKVSVGWLSGEDSTENPEVNEKLLLAARSVSSLKQDDLNKVLDLLVSMKKEDKPK